MIAGPSWSSLKGALYLTVCISSPRGSGSLWVFIVKNIVALGSPENTVQCRIILTKMCISATALLKRIVCKWALLKHKK